MNIQKILKITFIVILVFVVIFLGNFMGSGVLDYDRDIINGYIYYDSGKNSWGIMYRGDNAKNTTYIEPRVDKYIVNRNNILASRRPRSLIKVDENHVIEELGNCEYWLIDTIKHTKAKIDKPIDLDCYPLKAK